MHGLWQRPAPRSAGFPLWADQARLVIFHRRQVELGTAPHVKLALTQKGAAGEARPESMKNRSKPEIRAKRALTSWLLAGVAALALYGCSKAAEQPSNALAPVAEGAPIVDAPPADSLPPAPAVPVSELRDPDEAYAFPDRAYEMSDMFGEAPPDYVYDYEDSQPWVWISDDGSEWVAEAVPGGERYYYYEPGADEPFFIQDPSYGYGFEGGRLVAVYSRSGYALPLSDTQARAQIAGRYLARARSLYDASRHDTHVPVAQSNWMARRDTINAQRQIWQRQINADPNWRAFHAQNAPKAEAHWQDEKVQRLKWAAHVDETMHNQDQAVRERQQAEMAAARPRPSSPAPAAGWAERAAMQPGPSRMPGAIPSEARRAPQENFAQRHAREVATFQTEPGRPPAETLARREAPAHRINPEAAWQPSGHAPPPPERAAQIPRHEARTMQPPERAGQLPRHEARAMPQPIMPPREQAARARPPEAPLAARQARLAPPQERVAPVREARPAPPPRLAAAPRHEPPPQAPAPPPPRVAMAPRQPPARPEAAPPPARVEHQQAAAEPKPHPAPAKEGKHKG